MVKLDQPAVLFRPVRPIHRDTSLSRKHSCGHEAAFFLVRCKDYSHRSPFRKANQPRPRGESAVFRSLSRGSAALVPTPNANAPQLDFSSITRANQIAIVLGLITSLLHLAGPSHRLRLELGGSRYSRQFSYSACSDPFGNENTAISCKTGIVRMHKLAFLPFGFVSPNSLPLVS